MQPGNTTPQRYDYSLAGFGAFLTRSIDDTGQSGLSVDAPIQSRAVAFDRQQTSGSFGDTLRIGRIYLNGAEGNIVMNDGEVNRFLLGEDKDGF